LTIKKIEQMISTIIAICGIVALIFLVWSSRTSFACISDFPEYYAPARLFIEGNGAASYVFNMLGQEEHKLFPHMQARVVLLFIPPQGLALLSPIGWFSPLTAIIIWKTLLIACLVGGIVFLARTFRLGCREICYLIAALSLSQACFEVLRIDQLAPILFLALAAAIYLLSKDQDIAAGAFLSLMILKPQQILPLLAYLAGMRRWRPLLVFLGAFVFLSILAYVGIGAAGFKNYFDLMRAPESAIFMQPELNPTIRGQCLRFFPGANGAILVIAAIVYAIVIGLSYFWGRQNKNMPQGILWGILVVMPLGLLTSLHCHSYDLLLLVPTIMIIFTDAVFTFNPAFKLLLILGGIVFMLPLSVMIHHDYLLKGGQINIWFIELLILCLVIIQQVVFKKSSLSANKN